MESFSPQVQEEIKKIALNNGIQNFTVETSTVSNEGDGYIGILGGLAIIDKDSEMKLNLAVKRAPTNENLRRNFPTRALFLREIYLYNKLLTDFYLFQEPHNIPHPFKNTATFYGYTDEDGKETLFLDNLKMKGFRLYNRLKPLDSHHLKFVLKIYARFHAISHAMRRLEPERFEEVTRPVTKTIMEESQALKESGLEGHEVLAPIMASTIQILQGKPHLLEGVERTNKVIMKLIVNQDNEFAVQGHCDCWCANMLFKYEDETNPNIPTDMSLIDWQMSNRTHPVQDISYFFYISADKKDLQDYKNYLKVYHTALCENLEAFGLNPESFYSFEVLEEQWKEYSKSGFIMCQLMLQQTLSEKKTYDYESIANEEGDMLENVWRNKPEPSDLFKRRMTDLVEFLVENELI